MMICDSGVGFWGPPCVDADAAGVLAETSMTPTQAPTLRMTTVIHRRRTSWCRKRWGRSWNARAPCDGRTTSRYRRCPTDRRGTSITNSRRR